MGLGRWYWRHNSFWSDADRRRYRARQAQKRREVGARQKARGRPRCVTRWTQRYGRIWPQPAGLASQRRRSEISNFSFGLRRCRTRGSASKWLPCASGAGQAQSSARRRPSRRPATVRPATLMATPHWTPIATAAGRGKPLWVKVCAISVGVVFILIGVIGAIVQGSQPAPLSPQCGARVIGRRHAAIRCDRHFVSVRRAGQTSAPVVLSNWLVCSVSPPVGSRASHVTLTVVDTAGWAGGPTTC